MNKILSLSVSLLESRLIFSSYKKSRLFITKMGSVCGKNVTNMNTTTMTTQNGDIVESVVCKESDIGENEMKIFTIQDAGQVLIVKQNGKLSALGTKCTHFGAPLDKAALGEGRIRCQWHGACFNTTTGDIEDFPGLDSLPCYQVSTRDNNIIVKAKRSELTSQKRVKFTAKREESNKQKVVIIGGGPSGATCLEKLRQEGFTGSITLINKENTLPYDRTKVSKVLDFDVTKFQLRSQEYYKDVAEIMINTEVTKVDDKQKVVMTKCGKEIPFDYLYVASGNSARKINFKGGDNLSEIFTLRDFRDVQELNKHLGRDKNLVILGFGFIGMEIAATCIEKVKSVTIIGRDTAPFKGLFGEEIGMEIQKLFESKSIRFLIKNGITEVIQENGHLKSVVLENGVYLDTHLLVLGVGSTFNTEFLATSGVKTNDNGSVPVNEFLQTSVPNIYAGGDIAEAPVFVSDSNKFAIGHYGLAHFHGKVAALNILGKNEPLKTVPFFWTMFFGKGIRYAGHGVWDEHQIFGDLEGLKFIVYYYCNDKVVAMASCGRDPIVSQFAELLQQNKRIYKEDVLSGNLPWKNEE